MCNSLSKFFVGLRNLRLNNAISYFIMTYLIIRRAFVNVNVAIRSVQESKLRQTIMDHLCVLLLSTTPTEYRGVQLIAVYNVPEVQFQS